MANTSDIWIRPRPHTNVTQAVDGGMWLALTLS